MSFPDLLGAQSRRSSLGTSGSYSQKDSFLPCNSPAAQRHHQCVEQFGTGCSRLGELRAGLGWPAVPPLLPPAAGTVGGQVRARPHGAGRRSCSQGWKRNSKPQGRQRGDVCPFAREAFGTSGFLLRVSIHPGDVPTMTNSSEP